MAEIPEPIRRYFDGINNERWEEFRGLWQADAEVICVGGHHYHGLDEVLGYYTSVLAPFPVHYDDLYADTAI